MAFAGYDETTEKSVLGALLLGDKFALGTVTSIITSRDFYQKHHQQTFEAIIRLADKGEGVDLLTVRDELIRHDIFEQVGGLAFLMGLFDSLPTAAHVADYAKTVRLCALWRGH